MITLVKVATSILSADFARLADELKKIDNSDMVHVDVMDGRFVPNITIGQPVVKSLKKATSMPLDVHLMIEQPEAHVDEFIKAGADIITVHVETTKHLHRLIERIKAQNVKAAVALNPHTPLCSIENILDYLDMVLIMTVNPGFPGQKFIPEMVDKIKKLKSYGKKLEIQVDGGITVETAPICIRAGADILVSGNYVFSAQNPKEAIDKLRNC